ncbi:protocadherin Fat 1 isoform X2 [Patella vulgata]|uniref:protocadherin Fat 1 isoform X2 n=1 Tax=Patella vulgata TaxID=6465 RepID=UPI0021808C38|nr:protocadherin Fat 1 isoform X2 [Patella vulgata]
MLMRSLIVLLTLTSVSGLSFFCTQFRPLKVRINETAIRGSVIKTILEPDDKVSSVQLLAGDLSYLNINVQRRQLRLLKPVRDKRGQILIVTGTCSDYLEPYRYMLNLSVSIEVEILDVNDPPQFINLPTSTSVSESTQNGSWVFDIQADNPDDVYNDFTRVYYSILSSGSIDKPQESVDNWFIVDDNGRVHLNTKLDFEEGPRKIKLVVKVQDFGIPVKRNISTLTILVKDVDDMGPRFDQQFVSFTIIGEKPVQQEECLPTTPPLYAEDQDAEIKSPIGYRLNQVQETNSSINWSKYFHINPITGQLCQRHTVQGIQTKRGDITVQEVMDAFNLTVEAFQLDDPDKTARAVIMVKISNENLYKPTFLQINYTVDLPEYPVIGPGTLVTTVVAEDRDYGRNGEFLLSLSVNPFNAFSINPTTGEIRVEKPELIDREQNSTLILKVKAEETKSVEGHVSSPEAQVQITLLDVNDNSPIFNKSLFNFTVKDNHQIGTAIHKFEDRLVAEDADEGKNGLVRLAIVSVQNMRGTFSLNDYQRFRINDEGVIILQSSLRALRREENHPEYIVVVQARDSDENEKQQRSTTTRVFIKVLEANDYPPVFEKEDYKVYISEAAPVGTLITEIKVTDEDGDEDLFVKYEITSGNIGDDFRISERGFLFIERPLDREKVSFYHLTVSASDGLHVRETMVTVNIRDTNDNSPVFSQTIFDFYIPENVTSRLDIGSVTATDADEGPNSKLVYRLSGTNSHIFNITKDGLLVLNGPSPVVDREKTEVIILQVIAEDLGQPPQKEDAMIRIYLQDINDEPPVFTHSVYRVKMMEPIASDVAKNQTIDMDVSLTVTDNDVDAEHRDVVYSLHDGGLGLFYIDETTGSLFVTDTSLIDCEANDTYTFKISAFDGNFTTFTTLILDIEDRNDNSPRFTSNMSFVSSPSSRIGSLVGQLTSEDKDVTEQNSHVVYLLLGGSLDKFSVNSKTGQTYFIFKMTRWIK